MTPTGFTSIRLSWTAWRRRQRHIPEDTEVRLLASKVQRMRVWVALANQRVALGDERRALGSGAAMVAARAQYAACTPSRSLSGIARDPLW